MDDLENLVGQLEDDNKLQFKDLEETKNNINSRHKSEDSFKFES